MSYFSCLRWSLASGSCGRQVPAELVGCGAIHTSFCSLLLPNTRCVSLGWMSCLGVAEQRLPGCGRPKCGEGWWRMCVRSQSLRTPGHVTWQVPPPALLSANAVCVWFLWLLPRVTKTSALLAWEGLQCAAVVGRLGGKGIGAKLFLLSLFPSGLLRAELSYLGHASPVAAVTPSAGCTSGLAWLPLPCCWCQADLFSVPVLLPAQACLEGDAVLPGLWPPLLRCPCPAGPWSTGLAPWSTGHRAARAPDKPLAGSGPRTCWQFCAFTWG